MTYILLSCILIVGFLIRIPRFGDSVPSDFGPHMYLAQAWREGRRLYLDLPGGKPPGMYYLYMAVYKWWGRSPEAIRAFISVWYSLTTISVFLLARSVFPHDGGALVAASIFALLTALPQFWSSFTHAENFMLLPETLALALFLSSDTILAYLAVGILLGISFQFKPTALALMGMLTTAGLFISSPLLSACFIPFGFVVTVLLPLPYFLYIGRTSGWQYFCNTINFFRLFDKHGRWFRGKYPGFDESFAFHEKTSRKPKVSSYAEARYATSLSTDISIIRGRLRPLLATTGWVWLLVLISGMYMPVFPQIPLLTATCLLCIAVALVQRAYFPSHFLPATPSASVLVGWIMVCALTTVRRGGTWSVTAIFILALGCIAMIRVAASWYVQSFVYSRDETLSFITGRWTTRWLAAQEVASLFRDTVAPFEYVLQFGDEPQVYYLSGRRPASNTLTWVYPAKSPFWRLLFTKAVNQWRPAKIAFFEPDSFDMSLFAGEIDPEYEQSCVIRDEFPVFSRVDTPVDILRADDVYLFPPTPDCEPEIYTDQTAPTASFVSLIVIGNCRSPESLTRLACSLGEPVEIVCIEFSHDRSRIAGPQIKVLHVPDTTSTAFLANRGIQIARGDRLLFVNADDLPDSAQCRKTLGLLNSDIRTGVVAPSVVPARCPIAVRTAALFRTGELNRDYETMSAAFTELIYRATWVDFRCKQTEPQFTPAESGIPESDRALLSEKVHISIKQLAEYYR